jgi:hypothetical protein
MIPTLKRVTLANAEKFPRLTRATSNSAVITIAPSFLNPIFLNVIAIASS